MRALPLGATLALALVGLPGCTGDASYDPDEDTSTYGEAPATESFDDRFRDDYEEAASLPDGRRVRLWYSAGGDELLEQHYSPTERSWSGPRVVFASAEPHPCQGIDIVEEDGVVAVIADFGLYCYDGEPPMQSVAAVSSGDLTEWAVDVTDGFDGWTSLTLDEGGARWTGSGRSLTWTEDGGFDGGAPTDA